MAIKVKVQVRDNTLANQKVASANIVDLQQMDFDEFCDYLAQDSTVGAADVSAVMKQLEKKLPLLLGMGTKVQISAEGMTVRPTVSGSLTQSELKAKLQKRVSEGETGIDVNRTLFAADLTVNDLTAGVAIDFSKKFNAAFAQQATFKRVSSTNADTDTSGTQQGSGTGTGGTVTDPDDERGV